MSENDSDGVELTRVTAGLASLRGSAFNALFYLDRWFERAWNQWLPSMRVRGYRGPLAPVFDLGLLLAHSSALPGEPPAGAAREERETHAAYAAHMQAVAALPLLGYCRERWEQMPEGGRPAFERDIIFDLLDHFPAPPETSVDADAKAVFLTARPGAVESASYSEVRAVDGRRLLVRRDGRDIGHVEFTIPRDAPAVIPAPPSAPDPLRQPTPSVVFRVATKSAEAVLDPDVVDACLNGPNLRPLVYDPPKRVRTLEEVRQKSTLPGQVGGVTRIEQKLPLDEWIDLVPSELALFLLDRDAGLAHLLNGKPLVTKHEREHDLVPKHRVLVVFVAENGLEEIRDRDTGLPTHRYPPYVYAKRQVFDLVRDLREAHQRLPDRVAVSIDIAVFILEGYREAAPIHRLFRLERLPPRRGEHDRVDRVRQAVAFHELVPGFFGNPRAAEFPTPTFDEGGGGREIVDARLDRFLQRQASRGDPFHALFIIPIGSQDRLHDFVPQAVEHFRFGGAMQRVMLIAVDPDQDDSDPRLKKEPAWAVGQSHSLHQAATRLGGSFLQSRPLAELRRDVVEMILGEARDRRNRAVRFA